MNSYLDKGLFLLTLVGLLYATDYLTIQNGYVTFTSLFAGSIVMILIGVIIRVYENAKAKS